MLQIDESTRCFRSRCSVLESYREPGMILLQVRTAAGRVLTSSEVDTIDFEDIGS